MALRLLSRLFGILFIGTLFYCSIVWLSIRYDKVNWLPNFYTTAGGYGQLLLRLRDAQEVEKVDLLFIGSSHAYRGFDVREFEKAGYSSFNLGSTSQTPYNSYYLLKEYLPRMRPKVVVMDMYWRMLGHDATESTIDIVSNTRVHSTFMEMVARAKNGMVLNSLLINGILRTQTPLHKLQQQPHPDELYIAGGFTQSLLHENTLSPEELRRLNVKQFVLSRRQQEYLHKIIALCQQHEVQLVWVATPVTPEYRSLVHNYADYLQAVSSLAQQHQIPFIDYNLRSELQLKTREDFYDKDHLTQQGVVKFNRLLLEDLSTLKSDNHMILAEN
jgi:hypothetical protein